MKKKIYYAIFIITICTSLIGVPAMNIARAQDAAPQANAGTALQFNGSSQYVSFGPAVGTDTGLGVKVFTIELWLNKTGAGVAQSTGSGGITAIPLVTKGRAQADGTSVDVNYFLGIDANRHLVADFEECARAMTGCPATASNLNGGGQNYPVTGGSVIADNTWYHVAATFDGRYWKLYLNGLLETTMNPNNGDTGANRLPRWDSTMYSALATTLNDSTTLTPLGYFAGVIDEVRIWNVVRTQTEIQSAMLSELTSGTGLIGRWGLNEGSGNTATNSITGRPNGSLLNTPAWVTGFPLPDTTPPAAPTHLIATPYSGGISLSWTAPGDLDLAGYNVYRAESPNVPISSPINGSTLVTTTSYQDSGLTNGTPYYYVVTAKDTSNNESVASNEVNATPLESLGSALKFDGTNDFVTFGPAPGLDQQYFTVETWFMRTGTGVAVSTGSNGVLAVPLVTKGSPEADGSNVDENYILGIRSSDNVLAGDFEIYSACNTRPAGDNNPIVGVTPIVNNTWYHAAFTYDGTALKLYLNGNLEATLASTCLPRYDSIQHAGLGTYLTSTGTSSGYFQGVLDEVRIWSYARSQAEIIATINSQLTSGTNLVARWGLNEGTGLTINSSVGTFPGTLTNGPTWAPGAPFNITFAPDLPVLVQPTDGALGVPVDNVNLQVGVNDFDSSNLTVNFYGRVNCPGPSFTLIALPDTQYYCSQTNSGLRTMFDSQTSWIVNNQTAENIKYVMHLGDIVDTNSDTTQWDIAGKITPILGALTALDNAGIPYGLTMGNHDGAPDSTANFNSYFGVSRFSGRSYYGGHYGSDNDNSYGLFSADGLGFIVFHFEYGVNANVIAWADDLLTNSYPTHRAIIVYHELFTSCTTLSTVGQNIYNAFSDQPNFFLMLGGHNTTLCQLTLTRAGMNQVYALQADYQNTFGGDGYLRIMKFQPSTDQIQVSTYSPFIPGGLTDGSNQFNLTYDLSDAGCSSFTLLESLTNVPRGTNPSYHWDGRGIDVMYDWYVTVSDGTHTVTSPIWSFTTGMPTVVRLADFTATSTPSGIKLDWQTVQESDLLGFNIYRADTQDGPRSMLNADLIPGLNGGQIQGNPYQYMDATTEPGKTYFYWVEWVGMNGNELIGPTTTIQYMYFWLTFVSR